MYNEELLKKLEFDIRFKYSPVYFIVEDFKSLEILYYMTEKVFEIKTNSSYIEYLMDEYKNHNNLYTISCIFFIDLDNKKSDVVSKSYSMHRNHMYEEFSNLERVPDYIYNI